MKNLLSVDLEDWFHFLGDPAAPQAGSWAELHGRVERNTRVLLEAMAPHKATFFCLGWVAQRHPGLIREIAAAGHEIGSHGYGHDLVFQLGPKRFAEDLARTKAMLEDIAGCPVTAFRAPGFSIRPQDTWALDVIRETGHLVDSSIFPGFRTKGGVPGASPYPHARSTVFGDLLEIPVSTKAMFGLRTAFCGGGFFRFCPYGPMRREILRLNQAGHPAVLYIHPRDIDPGQPRMKLRRLHAFMYYYGLQGALDKFKQVMKDFAWRSFADYASSRHDSDNQE